MIGSCVRCGQLGSVEHDHPTGTIAGRHLHPAFTVPLCPQCHRGRSLVDKRAGIEGGNAYSPLLIIRRLAAWSGWLATGTGPLVFDPIAFRNLAQVLELVARELTE